MRRTPKSAHLIVLNHYARELDGGNDQKAFDAAAKGIRDLLVGREWKRPDRLIVPIRHYPEWVEAGGRAGDFIGRLLQRVTALSSLSSEELGDVILYFVGHGFNYNGNLLLSMPNSLKIRGNGLNEDTWCRLEHVAFELSKTFPQVRFYFLLDCCFASSLPNLDDWKPKKSAGATFLYASKSRGYSFLNRAQTNTLFAQGLMSVEVGLRPRHLSFNELYGGLGASMAKIAQQEGLDYGGLPQPVSNMDCGGKAGTAVRVFPNPKAPPEGRAGAPVAAVGPVDGGTAGALPGTEWTEDDRLREAPPLIESYILDSLSDLESLPEHERLEFVGALLAWTVSTCARLLKIEPDELNANVMAYRKQLPAGDARRLFFDPMRKGGYPAYLSLVWWAKKPEATIHRIVLPADSSPEDAIFGAPRAIASRTPQYVADTRAESDLRELCWGQPARLHSEIRGFFESVTSYRSFLSIPLLRRVSPRGKEMPVGVLNIQAATPEAFGKKNAQFGPTGLPPEVLDAIMRELRHIRTGLAAAVPLIGHSD